MTDASASVAPGESTGEATASVAPDRSPQRIDDLIVEIVSDSGEGAQKAGQSLGAVSAKMGNGVWTWRPVSDVATTQDSRSPDRAG